MHVELNNGDAIAVSKETAAMFLDILTRIQVAKKTQTKDVPVSILLQSGRDPVSISVAHSSEGPLVVYKGIAFECTSEIDASSLSDWVRVFIREEE